MMKKSTKGAFAAAAAGSLLLGGAGSLAYWTDASTVDGKAITSGHLQLNPITATCDDSWQLDGEAFKQAGFDELFAFTPPFHSHRGIRT